VVNFSNTPNDQFTQNSPKRKGQRQKKEKMFRRSHPAQQ
jgi:hypothetical protein